MGSHKRSCKVTKGTHDFTLCRLRLSTYCAFWLQSLTILVFGTGMHLSNSHRIKESDQGKLFVTCAIIHSNMHIFGMDVALFDFPKIQSYRLSHLQYIDFCHYFNHTYAGISPTVGSPFHPVTLREVQVVDVTQASVLFVTSVS